MSQATEYNLPEGVATLKELVERYMAVDPNLKALEVIQRIKDDHGLEVNEGTVKGFVGKYKLNLRGPARAEFYEIKKLVADILEKDPRLDSPSVHRLLTEEHKINVKQKTVEGMAYRWRRKNGAIQHRPAKQPRHAENGHADGGPLEKFAQAVKAIGGRKVALTILSLFEE